MVNMIIPPTNIMMNNSGLLKNAGWYSLTGGCWRYKLFLGLLLLGLLWNPKEINNICNICSIILYYRLVFLLVLLGLLLLKCGGCLLLRGCLGIVHPCI